MVSQSNANPFRIVALMAALAAATPAWADDDAQSSSSLPDWVSLHIQGTVTNQEHPAFHSAIPDGPESMKSEQQSAETTDVTLYLGVRLGGLEVYFNPEQEEGFGPSGTFGIAGYTTGEAYKVGQYAPYYRTPRLFGRYVVDLGGEAQTVEDGLNQLAGTHDADNLTVTFGKFSVVDIFDNNAYAHDPKNDFLNWSIIELGAFDYAAESWGYTYGATAEWNQDWWTLRGGVFDMSRVPNDKYLDRGFGQYQAVAEAEERHEILGNPGKVRALFFLTSAKQGSYMDAVALGQISGETPDAQLVAHHQMRPGGGINAEQQILPDLGAFFRVSANDGAIEEYDFTDINRSLSGGLSLTGQRWDRPADAIGLGAAANAISKQARAYFAAGGLGGLVGDGQLPSYAAERIVETYYKAEVVPGISVAFDYQRVVSPGYDAVRGPINFFTVRLHAFY
jgi:high affinity Mn2+ porin